jgi:hypothetical protein
MTALSICGAARARIRICSLLSMHYVKYAETVGECGIRPLEGVPMSLAASVARLLDFSQEPYAARALLPGLETQRGKRSLFLRREHAGGDGRRLLPCGGDDLSDLFHMSRSDRAVACESIDQSNHSRRLKGLAFTSGIPQLWRTSMRKLQESEFDLVSGGGAFIGPDALYQKDGPNDIEAGIAASVAGMSCTSTTNWPQFFDGTIQRGEGALLAASGLAAGLRSGNFTVGTNAAMAVGTARFANGVYLQQSATSRTCAR